MHFSSTLLVGSVVAVAAATSFSAGQIRSLKALDKIMGRQFVTCAPVSVPSCALSCGEGYTTCISWPTCYNPGKGDTCCSDGSYCLTGEYCTDVGCCPVGSTLEECGATSTLSVILPVIESSTTSAASTSSAVVTTTTSSSAVVTTSSSSSKSSSVVSSSSSSSSVSSSTTSATTTTRATTTRAPSGGSSTSSNATTSPIFTGAAQAVGVGAAQVALGGLAMFMML